MATQFDPTLRHTKGGARWIYKEVNGDGSDLDTPDTWHAGPAIKESGLKDDTARESYGIESGETYSQDGSRTLEWSGMFAQNDIETKRLMVVTMRGKYYAILKEESTTPVNGKYPKLFIPAARAIPSTDRKLPGGEIPFAFEPSALSDSMTVNLASGFDSTLTAKMKGTFTGTITVNPGEAYLDFEIT